MSGKAFNLFLCGLMVLLQDAVRPLICKWKVKFPHHWQADCPLALGVYYNDNFLNYVFTEKSEVRKTGPLIIAHQG